MATSNLRDLMPPAPEKMDVAGSVEAGVQTGIKLATAKEQIEQQKLKVEEMKNDLAVKQASTANSLISNLVNASPVIAKKMLPQVRQRFIQLGLDPDVADLVISDDNYRANASALTAMMGGQLTANPRFAQQYIASLRQAGLTDQAIQQYIMGEMNRAQQMNLEQAKLAQQSEKETKAEKPLIRIAEEKAASEVGKDYATWQSDRASVEQDIAVLEKIKQDIASGNLTTRFAGSVPRFMRPYITPDTDSVQNAVESVLVKSLKTILGGQFTEKDRESIIENAFNPKQTPENNARQLELKIQDLKTRKAAKDAAVARFRQSGSIIEQGNEQDSGEFVDDTGDAAANEPATEVDMQEVESMVKDAVKRNPKADPEKLRQAIIKRLQGG